MRYRYYQSRLCSQGTQDIGSPGFVDLRQCQSGSFREEGVLYQTFGRGSSTWWNKWTQSDLRFCKNDRSKRYKIRLWKRGTIRTIIIEKFCTKWFKNVKWHILVKNRWAPNRIRKCQKQGFPTPFRYRGAPPPRPLFLPLSQAAQPVHQIYHYVLTWLFLWIY